MKKITGSAVLFSILAMSCSHHTYTVANGDAASSQVAVGWAKKSKTEDTNNSNRQVMVKLPEVKNDKKVNYLPDATAFRMSGDYADNVAVTLGPDGNLLYFPDPSDITADSKPIDLGNGWWLNNQGLGPNSVFTKYTFAEYAALPVVPSPSELKNAIIPGAKVTGFIELPMKVGEANSNIEAAKEYVKNR